MHSKVTRKWYGSRKRAGLLRNSTFWEDRVRCAVVVGLWGLTRIVTMDIASTFSTNASVTP
jgi:hypothetical protein